MGVRIDAEKGRRSYQADWSRRLAAQRARRAVA
jgi:hypothetical protein